MYFRMIKRTNQHKFKSVVMATTTNCYFQTSTMNVGWNHRQRVKYDFMPGTKSICSLRVIGKLWVYFVGFNTGIFLFFFIFLSKMRSIVLLQACEVVKGQIKVKCDSRKWTITENNRFIKLEPRTFCSEHWFPIRFD